jgi:hypothetical protein
MGGTPKIYLFIWNTKGHENTSKICWEHAKGHISGHWEESFFGGWLGPLVMLKDTM